MSESPYIKLEMENHPEEPEYLADLRILRRFVQNGSFGYRESDDAVFQTLKARYPQAYYAFGRERKREVLEQYARSPYIEEQRRTYPNNPDKDIYLKSLERLRHVMVLFRLGYGSREMAMLKVNSKRRYHEAHEVDVLPKRPTGDVPNSDAPEPLTEPSEQTPTQYTQLVLGDVERPSAVIEPIGSLPESQLKPLPVGRQQLGQLQTILRHAPGLAKSAATASSNTYVLRFPPEIAQGIRTNSLKVMQSAEGGLRGVAVDAQGKIVAHGTLVPASGVKVATIAAGVFQVLAIATAQYYLPQINRRLGRIEQGIREIQEHLAAQDRAILVDSLRQLRSTRDLLEEGDFEERDVLAALIGLDTIDRDSGRVQEAYREHMERYKKELDELALSGFFAPDFEAANEKATRYGEAALVCLQAMYVRSVAAQLRGVAGGRMAQARLGLAGLLEHLEAWNKQRQAFYRRFEERIREDATAALDLDDLKEALGDEDTLANRRKNVLSAARERQGSLIASYRELRQAVREVTERTERQLSAASEPLTLVVEMNERDEIERVYEQIA